MTADLAVSALRQAVARAPAGGHRGGSSRPRGPISSEVLRGGAQGDNLTGSMGRVSSAGDNAAMESFYSLLQKNVLDRRRWTTRAELAYAILVWIEHTYNRRRRQRSLGKLTPVEFELAFTSVTGKHRSRRVHGHVRGSLALVASPPSQGSERYRLRRAPRPGRTTTSIPRGVPTTPRPRPSLSPPRARCP
jgi:hypothetical protein